MIDGLLANAVLASAWLDRLLAPGPARTMALAMIGFTLILAGALLIVMLIRGRPTPADRALRLVERHSGLDRRARRAIRDLASSEDGPPPISLYLSEHAFQTSVQRAQERGHLFEIKPLQRACVQLGYSSPWEYQDAAPAIEDAVAVPVSESPEA